ncbi:MAG: DUF6522 family protein [Hyphomicrobiaceae bacterium]
MTINPIEFENGVATVDASVIAHEFGIDELTLRDLMSRGEVTSTHEVGTDEDAGRHRLTFFHGDRQLRMLVDADGLILDRRVVDFGEWPALPTLLGQRSRG